MGAERVTVRTARADDAEALATAHVRAWQAAYRGILPQDYLDAIDLDARVEQWRGWIAHGRFRLTDADATFHATVRPFFSRSSRTFSPTFSS